MTAPSPIHSTAQHTMLAKAASDVEYAKSRGITQSAAQTLLDGHKAAGSPTLPDRVEPEGATPRTKKPSRKYKLLGAH